MRENRRHIRLQAPIGMVYRRAQKGKKGRPSLTLVRNLSGGGLSFAPKEAFRQGDLLEIELQIPHLADPVKAIGEVVWVRDGETGLRFRDIESADLRQVFEYVHAVGIG